MIKEENIRRKRAARDKVHSKLEVVNSLMEYVNVIPAAPNVPQIFSIGGGQEYPIDFNMKVQILNDQDKVAKRNARKQEIERELIAPLSAFYTRLGNLRVEIKILKTERDRLKDSIKDVDELNMDDDEIENLQNQKDRYE